jgi:hypothetical protein
MKHQHRPILWLTVFVLLAIPAIAGGPILFVVLVMAAPLVVVIGLSAWAVVNGAPQGGHRRDRAHKDTFV